MTADTRGRRRKAPPVWLISLGSLVAGLLVASLVYFLVTQLRDDDQGGGGEGVPAGPRVEDLTVELVARVATLKGRVVFGQGATGDVMVDWGDGGSKQQLQLSSPGLPFSVTHPYRGDGTYTITVEAVSRGGRSAFGAVTAVIRGAAGGAVSPAAGGAASPAAGGAASPAAGGAAPTATPTPIPTPTATPATVPAPATPVALKPGTWSIKMVAPRGNAFYPNLAVNFSQSGGSLIGDGPYTYSSGGTTLVTEVLNGTVNGAGDVTLTFTVKEGNALRATFTFTGRAGSGPPSAQRDKISGDDQPGAGSGFEVCTPGCGYSVTLESGATETGFFTMSTQ